MKNIQSFNQQVLKEFTESLIGKKSCRSMTISPEKFKEIIPSDFAIHEKSIKIVQMKRAMLGQSEKIDTKEIKMVVDCIKADVKQLAISYQSQLN